MKQLNKLLSNWVVNFIIGGWVSMLLWNGIMVDLTGVHRLTFWRAVGLVILIHCLFPTANIPIEKKEKK